MKLEFMLYCDDSPVALGIEDAQGNWDMTKFKSHIESCQPCQRFIELLTLETIDVLALCVENRKGSPKAALAYKGKRPHDMQNQIPTLDTEV